MNKRTEKALAEIKSRREAFSTWPEVRFLSVPVLVRMDDGKLALVCALDDDDREEAIAVSPGEIWMDRNGKVAKPWIYSVEETRRIIDIYGLWDGSDI